MAEGRSLRVGVPPKREVFPLVEAISSLAQRGSRLGDVIPRAIGAMMVKAVDKPIEGGCCTTGRSL